MRVNKIYYTVRVYKYIPSAPDRMIHTHVRFAFYRPGKSDARPRPVIHTTSAFFAAARPPEVVVARPAHDERGVNASAEAADGDNVIYA